MDRSRADCHLRFPRRTLRVLPKGSELGQRPDSLATSPQHFTSRAKGSTFLHQHLRFSPHSAGKWSSVQKEFIWTPIGVEIEPLAFLHITLHNENLISKCHLKVWFLMTTGCVSFGCFIIRLFASAFHHCGGRNQRPPFKTNPQSTAYAIEAPAHGVREASEGSLRMLANPVTG